MGIIQRVKNICLTPSTEWNVIGEEQTPTGQLITGYVIPLATLGAVAGFIGGSIVGRTVPFFGTFRTPVIAGVAGSILAVVMAVVVVFVISVVINALAPTFGAQQNSNQSMKIAAYSFTPAWVAGVLQIIPLLGILVLFASLYGLYLLYLGLPRLMKCPADKALGYTAVVAICGIGAMVIVGLIGGAVTTAGLIGSGAIGSVTGGGDTGAVEFDPDSPLGALQQLGETLEESAANIETAQESGDPAAQVNAALEGLGAVLGGGRRVEPIEISELQGFIPETFLGLPRTSTNAERSGVAALMVTRAEATYSDGAGRTVNLEVVDTGGASGLMGLASWVGIESQREDDQISERTQRIGDRMVHERTSKVNGSNEFDIVLADRFIVSTNGSGVEAGDLQEAVLDLDLEGLEAMRDQGVEQ